MKLTVIARTDLRVATSSGVGDSSPEKIDGNKRRRQRRLFFVLDRETVAIETPRLFALLFHCLVFVATTTGDTVRILDYLAVRR